MEGETSEAKGKNKKNYVERFNRCAASEKLFWHSVYAIPRLNPVVSAIGVTESEWRNG